MGRVKRTFLGYVVPVLTCFQPFWPILVQCLPGLETVMELNVNRAQQWSKMTSFKSGPRPFGKVKRTGHFGPVLISSMAIPDTGYRIPDTGHRYTGRRAGIPVREMGKIQHGPKTSQN